MFKTTQFIPLFIRFIFEIWIVKRRIIKFLRNKYVLVTLLNLVYILFIHNINLVYIIESKWEAERLQQEIDMMKVKNKEIQDAFMDISNNGATLERYAREQFYMKRDNEEVFIIKSE